MGLVGRILGSNPNKSGDVMAYMFGRDQHFCLRSVEGAGSHLQDNDRLLAYYTAPGCIAERVRKVNGRTQSLGPIAIGYDLITGLWNFPLRDWPAKPETKTKQTESDVVLDQGFAEGSAEASQKQERAAWMKSLTTILLLAVLGALLILVLIGIQTGIIGNFFAGIGRLFH